MAKKREVWDAVDELLGFDLYRDEWGKKPIPEGAHHRVVEIFTVTKQGEVLCTQRDPKKRIFALKWEVTGGSVVKGEKPLAGAVRELREETGIVKQPEELTFLLRLTHGPTVFYVYAATVESADIPITLQANETIDYKFLPYDKFCRFPSGAFPGVSKRTRNICKASFERRNLQKMTEKKSIIHLCAFLLNFGACCVKISDGLKTGGLPAMRKVGVV